MTQPINLRRRSTVMAAGTVASRATGFLRVLALGYALGFNRLSDAYNLANTLPQALAAATRALAATQRVAAARSRRRPVFRPGRRDVAVPWTGVRRGRSGGTEVTSAAPTI